MLNSIKKYSPSYFSKKHTVSSAKQIACTVLYKCASQTQIIFVITMDDFCCQDYDIMAQALQIPLVPAVAAHK